MTARDRFVKRYRIFTVVGMLMCAVSVILLWTYIADVSADFVWRILFGGIYDGFVSDDWHKED